MALQAKESTRRNYNGASHSEDHDSLHCRSFRMRSSLEKACNNELLSVKFHSPPPKPPRRRNSGQRVVTPTGCSSPKNCSEMTEEASPQQINSLTSDPSLLFEEVKVLRDMNDQLWKHLCSTQSKLDQLQNASLSPETENVSSPAFAELLSSIYYAQKEKEELIESRLQVAINERDAAVHELEELVGILGRSFQETITNGNVEDISDKTVKELLKEVETTQDPAKLMQQHNLLLTYLCREKKGKLGHVSPDLKVALVEKNNALTMIQHLEEELHHWKHSSDGWHKDTKQWESSLLDILCQVISQRDSAYQRVNHLQDELNSLRHRYRQQKVSSDKQMSSSFEGVQTQEHLSLCQGTCRIHCTSSEVIGCEDSGDKTSAVNCNGPERMPSEVELLKNEILVLTQTLQSEMKARQIAEESCSRLERLVCVLRKKVNGLHVGVQV